MTRRALAAAAWLVCPWAVAIHASRHCADALRKLRVARDDWYRQMHRAGAAEREVDALRARLAEWEQSNGEPVKPWVAF